MPEASPVQCVSSTTGTPGAGVTIYPALASNPRLRMGDTVEVHKQLKYSVPGVFSKLIAVVSANTTTGSSTIDFRKAAASGNSSVSIGAGATGTFEDLSRSDTIAAGDLVNLRIVNAAGGSLTLHYVGMIFTATDTQTVQKIACNSANGYATPSGTGFWAFIGSTNLNTEAEIQLRIGNTYTASRFSLYSDNNTRSDISTVRTRKNTANGNQSFTIGAGATGFFEDTTNSDALVADDLYNMSVTLGAGTGSFSMRLWSVELRGPSQSSMWGNAADSSFTWAAGATEYLLPMGNFQVKSITESDAQFLSRLQSQLSYASMYVSANATAGASVFTFRKNGADTPIAMTVGAGATGRFNDTTNRATVGPNDLVNWKGVIGAGGTITLTMLSLLATDVIPDTPITGHGPRMYGLMYTY